MVIIADSIGLILRMDLVALHLCITQEGECHLQLCLSGGLVVVMAVVTQ